MDSDISPRYIMDLIARMENAIWNQYNSYKKVKFYIEKWYRCEESINHYWENFKIAYKVDHNIDLEQTLHNIDGETLLKMAIDLGLATPDFIPSVPIFRNEIKSDYNTASQTFEKAYRQIEEHPDIAVGLANSALESIVKEILKDERIKIEMNARKTLYELVGDLLKAFQLYPNSDMPLEIKTIGSSLLSVSQSIEKLRSEKTNLHGKTSEDVVIEESLYTCFIVNSVATLGLFLKSFYEKKFPILLQDNQPEFDPKLDLPF